MSNYEDLSATDICERIGQPYRKLQQYCIIACYNTAAHKHGDRRWSLTVYGYERGFYCYACGENGTNSWLLKQFNARNEGEFHVKTNQPKPQPQPVDMTVSEEYTMRLMALWESLPELPEAAKKALESKGFLPEMYEEMGTDELPVMPYGSAWRWHTNQVKGWSEGIFIPYMFDGKMVTARLRRLEGDPRFLSMPKSSMWPYNLDAVVRNPRVFVTEGETDALTLNFTGAPLPAVGIPGATSGTAIKRLMETAQAYGTQLVVLPDNDEAGEKFAQRMCLLAFDAKVACEVANVPFCKDVNEWYLQATHQQIEDFYETFAPAPPLSEVPADQNWWNKAQVMADAAVA